MRRRWPLLWLALYRRRRMLAALIIGMVVFEALIVVVANAVPPGQLFSAGGKGPPSAYRAFSGSSGDVSIASYPGLLGAGLTHPFWIAMQLTRSARSPRPPWRRTWNPGRWNWSWCVRSAVPGCWPSGPPHWCSRPWP
ncbi:hypothetical protein ACFCZQ_04645 [Streptomyces virginiae]|uniref:hypothetical protein n=1 Tax=Streptomyces virginiae TaxID=1961 RepID=UPI0035D81451